MGATTALAAGLAVVLVGASAAARATEVRTPPADSGAGSCRQSGCHEVLGAGAVVHAPVAEGACESCHEHLGRGHEFKATASPAASACLSCHDDPRTGGKVVHTPAGEGDCTLCHDPHSSANQALLVESGNGLCAMCHDVLADAESRPFVHGAVRDPGCTGCHDPHAAPAQSLLRAEGNALCLGCHGPPAAPKGDAAREVVLFGSRITVAPEYLARLPKLTLRGGRGHPVANHPVEGAPDPRTAGAVISCNTCHEPHNSYGARLFRGASGGRGCRQCHAK